MDTIAAIATPPGRGGVGMIRLSGPDACRIAQRLAAHVEDFTPRFARLASFYDADHVVLDQGLVLFFPGPASYTGDDVIELQAHGSPVLLRALLERTYDLGARPALPGEFTRRAVENGKLNLEQAEAVAACIDAATLRAARQAQRHLQGEFGRRINDLMHELTGLVAHVEACLDFPEEDVPPLFFQQLRTGLQEKLLIPIDAVLTTSSFGERLFQGVSIAIVGAPNVGKSTLMNLLSGRDRSITSSQPGTTRDIVEVDFELHGIPARLLDTAGLRESDDVIEQEGVRRARAAAASADMIIAMADASNPDTWDIWQEADVYIMNKADLLNGATDLPDRYRLISASSGEGVEAMIDALAVCLGEIPASEEGLLVTSSRHRQQLELARDHLQRGETLLGDAMSMDLVAMEWRSAWSCMGEVLGLGDVEHILDRVFSDFCIGK